MQYRKPSWYTTSWDPAKITDEQLAKWEAETAECEAHNNAVHKLRLEKVKQLRELALELWGRNSRIYMYLRKNCNEIQPSYGSSFKERIAKAREQAKKATEAKKAERDHMALTERAILWLQARGKVLGTDFMIDTALGTANQIAADEERERRISSKTWHQFSGDDYCEGCEGWDGVSRRCQCGNRRVDWETTDWHTFESPSIHAEAY